MKRRITKLVVLLLLGAIVNVAVAWGFGLWANRGSESGEQLKHNTVLELRRRMGFSTQVPEKALAFETVYLGMSVQMIFDGYSGYSNVPVPGDTGLVISCGWPSRSLQALVIQRKGEKVVITHSLAPPEILLDSTTISPVMPTHILWPGFAINTIFYAAILGLLFFAPGAVRRSIRRKRGVCPACDYPIGTSPVCTECGKSVRKPKAESQIAESP